MNRELHLAFPNYKSNVRKVTAWERYAQGTPLAILLLRSYSTPVMSDEEGGSLPNNPSPQQTRIGPPKSAIRSDDTHRIFLPKR